MVPISKTTRDTILRQEDFFKLHKYLSNGIKKRPLLSGPFWSNWTRPGKLRPRAPIYNVGNIFQFVLDVNWYLQRINTKVMINSKYYGRK